MRIKLSSSKIMRILGILFAFLLTYLPEPLRAQTQAPNTAGLRITVLKGEGGRNSVKSRTGVPIEIDVRDDQGKPVVGAQVIFLLPSSSTLCDVQGRSSRPSASEMAIRSRYCSGTTCHSSLP